jgi:hypothetical protein
MRFIFLAHLVMKSAPFYVVQNHVSSGAASDRCVPFYERNIGRVIASRASVKKWKG